MSDKISTGTDLDPPASPSQGIGRSRKLTGRTVLVLLLAFFGIVFSANGVLIHKALSTFGGVDTESSYRAGQMFEREVALAKAQEAQHWRVAGKVTPAPDGGAVVEIVARDAAGVALTDLDAAVTFERPTDRRLDRAVAIREESPGHFRGSAALSAGQWDLVTELSRQGERQFRSVNRVVLR